MPLTVFCALIESCSVQMGMCFVHQEFQLELQVYFCHPIKMLCSSVHRGKIAIKIINDNLAIVLQRLWFFCLFSICFIIMSCPIYNSFYEEQLGINAIFML